jgi:hypothetical protein
MALVISGIVAALIAPSSQVSRESKQSWPAMREFTVRVGVDLAGDRADIDIPLYDQHGIVQYRLICRRRSEELLGELAETTGIIYQPDLTCLLNPGDQEGETSLLAEEDAGPWQTRGYFAQDALIGSCGTYPEYGLVRHFRLRHFELTMALSNLKSRRGGGAPDVVTYGILTINLRRDPTATTAKAARPGYIDPRGDPAACASPRRGSEPLMCRNADTFAWEQCPRGWEYQPYSWENRITPSQ